MDALKVTSGGYWWVYMCPSELSRWKQSISIHLHTAQIVPPHNLTEEDEKHGAGSFPVSWKVEVVSIVKALSSAQAFLGCHLYIYITSSMQACVFMVCILHLISHLFPQASGLTLML